jgi:membrane associated rhomboid family serine protease
MPIGPNSVKKNVDIAPPDPKPIFTILMMLVMALPMYVNDGNMNWVEHHGFTVSKFAEFLGTSNYAGMIGYLTMTTFAQLSAVCWIFNALAMWCLGSVVEKKLRGWRFPLFMLIMLVASWSLVYVQSGAQIDKIYIGPGMLMFGLLGGYFAFFPKKPFKPEQWVRPATQIFKPDKKTATHERYWVSPWLYVIYFVIWEVIQQVALSMGKESLINTTHMEFVGSAYQVMFGRMASDLHPSAFAPVAALASIAIGAVLGSLLPAIALSLKPKRPGGKLQLEVIQHYRELRTLDMTHDQACEGAARFASVPIDIAKDWISKGAAGLKDQEIH